MDLRSSNSWTMQLADIQTPELAEVMAINTMAPFILNARLKPLLARGASRGGGPEGARFIVNVSAMEGKFYRYKSSNHPHTNMAKAGWSQCYHGMEPTSLRPRTNTAKAALNMMTRTSAADYEKAGIYMTAADTGWINDEKPLEKASAHEARHHFATPLDEVDAASRVLDPIIGPLAAAERGEPFDPPWGYFLKDYMKCEW